MDSVDHPPRLHVRPAEGRAAPTLPGHLSALLLAHGTMELRWFAPHGHDPQTPHDRDELYFVASGTAMFVRAEDAPALGDDITLDLRGEQRVAVQAGDALFVPAGAAHHFEAASADFGVWMVFYGPEGGEHR